MYAKTGLPAEVQIITYMVISAFSEGEAKFLSENAELADSDELTSDKSGLESWRLLKGNFDRFIRIQHHRRVGNYQGMSPATAIHDVLPKMGTLDRAHQEYQRQALASKDWELVAMRQNGIQVYPPRVQKGGLAHNLALLNCKGAEQEHTQRFLAGHLRTSAKW